MIFTSSRYSSFALSDNARTLHQLWLSRQRETQHSDHDRQRRRDKMKPSLQHSSCAGQSGPPSDAIWEGESMTHFDSEMQDSRDLQPSWSSAVNADHQIGSFSEMCTESILDPHDGEDPDPLFDQNLDAGRTPVVPRYAWYGCYGTLYDPTKSTDCSSRVEFGLSDV